MKENIGIKNEEPVIKSDSENKSGSDVDVDDENGFIKSFGNKYKQ